MEDGLQDGRAVKAIPAEARLPIKKLQSLLQAQIRDAFCKMKAAEQPERIERDIFRRSLSGQRRATLAIGAIMLNWAQWDSDITQQIFVLRDCISREGRQIGGREVSSLHSTRLSQLRRLIVACSPENSEDVRTFDDLVRGATEITILRGKIAHGLSGLANPSGTDNDLRLAIFLPVNDQSKGGLQPTGTFDLPLIWDIFDAADKIWDARIE